MVSEVASSGTPMNRKTFLMNCANGLGSCAAAGLIAPALAASGAESPQSAGQQAPAKTGASPLTPLVPVSARQIANTLSFIDSSMDESVKRQTFERLGYEHTTEPKFADRIAASSKDLKGFFDRINSHADTYWEKIEFIRDPSSIRVVGKVADRCACSYAQCDRPAKSLCNYCCRSFQQHLFEMLLQRPVRVQIDEAFLLGGKRCSTTVFFEGDLEGV
jgi:hypothetical protein